MEVTDNDGAVCRSTVQLVSVKTNQCFVLISYTSSAILHTITIVICVYLQLTPGYTKPIRCHHDLPEFSDICRWCMCPTPEGKQKN